jgi:hypothetical protein
MEQAKGVTFAYVTKNGLIDHRPFAQRAYERARELAVQQDMSVALEPPPDRDMNLDEVRQVRERYRQQLVGASSSRSSDRSSRKCEEVEKEAETGGNHRKRCCIACQESI